MVTVRNQGAKGGIFKKKTSAKQQTQATRRFIDCSIYQKVKRKHFNRTKKRSNDVSNPKTASVPYTGVQKKNDLFQHIADGIHSTAIQLAASLQTRLLYIM